MQSPSKGQQDKKKSHRIWGGVEIDKLLLKFICKYIELLMTK